MHPFDLKILVDTSPTPFTFVTGGAGTGKSTLLRGFVELLDGKALVCAPTGLAASLNNSRTIHSLFRLPTSIICHDSIVKQDCKGKIQQSDEFSFIQNAEYLIIDEVSMVRRDIIAGIDEVLCSACDSWLPFARKKVIMFGDMNQLPPVMNQEDSHFIKTIYGSPYFFLHYPFTRYRINIVELTKIYRQSDPTFARMLNIISRNDNEHIQSAIRHINQNCYNPQPIEDAVYLCPTNALADEINTYEMGRLTGKSYTLKASYSAGYNKRDAPVQDEITVKIGAKVLIRVNDKRTIDTETGETKEPQYFNGSAGVITGIGRNEKDQITGIYVKLLDKNVTVLIERDVFSTTKYVLKKVGKEENKKYILSRQNEWMQQFPLSIGFAITVHKSQGMTLQKANILGDNFFAHGQLYTALSRLETMEGLRLLQPLTPKMIVRDSKVDDVYLYRYEDKAEALSLSKIDLFSITPN